MEIFELATALGKKLKDDERLIALENAKKAYEEDADLKQYMMEYTVQEKAMQAAISNEERDMQLIEAVQGRIDTLYKQISEHPVFVQLNQAQAAVNELMNAVNNTIMFQITGEEPSSCTHNCSTCSGCH